MVFSTEKKEYTVNVPYDIWDSLELNSAVDLTIQMGDVLKINDQDIE